MNKKELMRLAKMLLKFATIPSDKGELMIEGDLAVGIEISILGEDGEYTPAPDGEYVTEQGTIKVEGGKVAEIVEAAPQEPEPTPSQEPMADPEPTPSDPTPSADEKDAKIAELEAANAELQNQITEKDAKIAELEAKVADLESKIQQPVEDPIEMKRQAEEKEERFRKNPALRFFDED